VSIRESSMARCPHTKLTIPECSCSSCLTEQVRKAAPALLETEEDAARRNPQARASGPAAILPENRRAA
jgi:hypothetical protein